jgi:hypothetical protein
VATKPALDPTWTQGRFASASSQHTASKRADRGRGARITGEKRIIKVTLSDDERQDIEHHALRCGVGPGSPDGPLARMYALKRAAQGMPREFIELTDEIQRVTEH